MSSISFSLQYDKDQEITFNVGGSLGASAYQFLHSNRRSGPFQQETVNKIVTGGKLTITLPKSVLNTFGEQEYYRVTANDSVVFDGDIYITQPKPLPEAMVTIDHISDATATGKSILKATDAASVRSSIGAGTSNVTIGTTAGTAKAGDYNPAWSDVTAKPTTFTPAAHTHVANDVTDATATGKSVITAASAAAARTAIGAGTSNITLGTTSTTAKAGDYVPAWNDVTSKPTTFAPSAHTHVIADVTDNVPVTKLSAAGATTGQVLSYNGSSISWVTPAAGGSATDATTTAKGIVQLAGDLAGTADAPTVPGLAAKANLTGATFTGVVNSTTNITAYSSSAAGMVTVGASSTLPTVRLGNSSGPTVTSSSSSGGSGGVIVNATNTSATVLSARGAASHASNLQDWRISSGSVLAYVDVNGKFITNGGLKLNGSTTFIGQPLVATDTSGTLGFGTPTSTQKAVTANYTVVAADAIASVLHSTASAAVTITLPDDTTSIPVEAVVRWRQYGAGQITFAPGTNVTLVSKNNLTHSSAQYSEGRLTKVAANTWLLSGDIA